MDWQPIETAPKDGRVLLAYNGDVFLMVLWARDHWQEWSSREPYDEYMALTTLDAITKTTKRREIANA